MHTNLSQMGPVGSRAKPRETAWQVMKSTPPSQNFNPFFHQQTIMQTESRADAIDRFEYELWMLFWSNKVKFHHMVLFSYI